MVIRETSLRAYLEIKPSLGKRQLEVLNALKELKIASNTQIADYMNRPINTITPRINELRGKGLVVCSHKGICPITKMMVMLWKVKD